MRTGRALIDVYAKEITLRVDQEAITFNLDQTSRYSSGQDDMSINRIDIIDVASKEYAQEILGFANNNSSGNPTPFDEPIVADSSPSFSPFEGGDLLWEEVEELLAIETSDVDDSYFDPEGDITMLNNLLNPKYEIRNKSKCSNFLIFKTILFSSFGF